MIKIIVANFEYKIAIILEITKMSRHCHQLEKKIVILWLKNLQKIHHLIKIMRI